MKGGNFLNIREKTENLEEKILSPFGTLAKNSKGREKPDDLCSLRTAFQVDRDRIIHSKAFRRLKHKTQVFISPEKDHYRTRLTHTLEVSQIARNIARALSLNEDLTEAIALGHDLGHTPFGHSGESALNCIVPGGFHHFEQSVRVVKKLEKDGRGLNLTYEVIDGILNHTKGKWPDTLEGKVVRFADRIAYINHDIDDAIRAKILTFSQLPQDAMKILGTKSKFRIDTFMHSLIENSQCGDIKMSEDVTYAFNRLHEFMYENVYLDSEAKVEAVKVPELITLLYKYLLRNSKIWPDDIKKIATEDGEERAVCDYIAGMTDQFAVELFKNLFIPKPWKL